MASESQEELRSGIVDIHALVEQQDWDVLASHFQKHPEEAKRVLDSKGWTALNLLCSIGSSPADVIELVAGLDPAAIARADTRYGDTPLHLVARHSQTSATKIKILLSHLGDENNEGLLIRNRFGGTVLHSACNHNAVLGVLQALVMASPHLLQIHTHDGIHPSHTLFSAYIQTINGCMHVARIIKGEAVDSGMFQRFWEKVCFMATADQPHDNEQRERMVLHGLLKCQILINFYKLALKWDPTLAQVASIKGDLPLHVLVERRPFRLKEKEAILYTLEAHPEAASIRNGDGDLPLFLAIRNKMPFQNGMDVILEACRSSVTRRDTETHLLPFQLAAAVGGKVAVENAWHLLVTQPDLLSL